MNVSSIMSSLYAKTATARKLLGTTLLASSTALSGCAMKIETKGAYITGEMYAPIVVNAMPVVVHPRPWIAQPTIILHQPPMYPMYPSYPIIHRPMPMYPHPPVVIY